MRGEIEDLIRDKCQNLPESIRQYVSAVFHQILELEIQTNVTYDQVNLILNMIQLSFDQKVEGLLILEIKYTQSTAGREVLPNWKILWTKGDNAKEARRIVEILEWICLTTRIEAIQASAPKYFSRCQEERVIFRELNGQTISLPVRDIVYLGAEGEFTQVFHGHKRELVSNLIDLSLKNAERLMADFCFYRIHRSYMVNLGCIRKIHASSSLSYVVLCSGIHLPIARRRKGALQEMHIQNIRESSHSL